MLTGLPVQGKLRTVTETDAQGNVKRIIELQDTVIGGVLSTDTVSILTYESAADRRTGRQARVTGSYDSWNYMFSATDGKEAFIAFVAILAVFGALLLIVLVALFFHHKNRQAKYRLAEQALAAGHPLPAGFFEQAGVYDIRSRGIRNIFFGIGLGILLWTLTGELWLASIGLFVMLTGCGQVVIYYTQLHDNRADRWSGKPGRQDDRPEQGNDDVQ